MDMICGTILGDSWNAQFIYDSGLMADRYEHGWSNLELLAVGPVYHIQSS